MIDHFVAFDFETANGKNACSIGIVEFLGGKVVNEYYSLIRPKELIFNPIASQIHGISISDVINEKEFDEIWGDISHFFTEKIIVAHNSSFDLSVLNYSFEIYGIDKPNFEILCTLKLSRNYLNIDNHKLSNVAKYFKIKQNNYHNALEDAFVCGRVFIELSSYAKNKTEIKDVSGRKLRLTAKKRKRNNSFSENRNINVNRDLIFEKEILNKNSNKLEGLKFVVSGLFTNFYRDEIKESIRNNGGYVLTAVSGKTDYLIAGDKMGPAKRSKAESLGVPIISEDDYIDMIKFQI